MVLHGVDKSALLLIGILAGVKNHAISRFHFHHHFLHFHSIPIHLLDASEKGSALFTIPGADQFLVVHSVHPASKKAS